LDALADELEIQVGQDDLTERLVMTSRQYGIEPQQLFAYLQENNQLPAMFADVRRGLVIAAVVEAATVTDAEGNTIDTSEFFGKRPEADEAEPVGEAEGADKSSPEADEAEPVGEAEDAGEAEKADETDEADGEAE
jgi:trigger factor